jgi:Mrp family chromosome partitioning ATPase
MHPSSINHIENQNKRHTLYNQYTSDKIYQIIMDTTSMSSSTPPKEEDTTTPTPQTKEEDTPDNANVDCVGPSSSDAGKASACDGCPNQKACGSGAFNNPEAKAKALEETTKLKTSLENVSHTILVLSGKGGVGKSTVSCQIAHTLASMGYAVGLLDVDLCGPSAPRMILGDGYLTAQIAQSASGGWIPVYNPNKPNLCCVSISFLLPDENRDQAVVWRGPRKNGLIQQFLTQVDWTGETDGLDYLIIDTPPGTSDEHISTVQYLQKANAVSGAILVTTPEEVCMADVRKELNFCSKTNVPVMGIIENMGIYTTSIDKLTFTITSTSKTDDDNQKEEQKQEEDCTQKVLDTLRKHCPELFSDSGESNNISVSSTLYPASGGGPKAMATQYNVPYWGLLPMDPDLLQACEHGQAFVEERPNSLAAKALNDYCQKIITKFPVEEIGDDNDQDNDNNNE